LRAILLRNINLQKETFVIEDEKFHHLKNVIRVKQGSEIKLLNGNDESVIAKVHEINKKNIVCHSIGDVIQTKKASHFLSIAFGLVKKDALEVCLKSCVELGCKEIIILKTEFSQRYELKSERVNSIIENAIEQSNLTHIPKLKIIELSEFDFEDYENVYLASMDLAQNRLPKSNTSNLILIGPEGGFSTQEISIFKNTINVHIKGGILRTQTAIGAVAGYVNSMVEKIDA